MIDRETAELLGLVALFVAAGCAWLGVAALVVFCVELRRPRSPRGPGDEGREAWDVDEDEIGDRA